MKNLYNWCVSNKRFDLVNEWSKELNHMDIKEVPKNSKKLYWWSCKKGHTYKSSIEDKIANKTECPVCGGNATFPEFVISYLLNKYYPVSMNYRAEWLNKREIDIYLPKANCEWNGKQFHKIGIEYDGARYHQDAKRDLAKNEICEEHGIHIIRIREVGAVALPDTEECIILTTHTNRDVFNAVQKLLVRLGVENPRINYNRDVIEIQKKYNTYIKQTRTYKNK